MFKVTFFLIFCLALAACQQKQSFDLLLVNGKVYSHPDIQEPANTIGIRGNKIAFVGDFSTLNGKLEQGVKRIDLKGKPVYPGFIEGHGHLMGLGQAIMQLNLQHIDQYSDIISLVESTAKELPAGEWIIGRGWHQDKWKDSTYQLVHGFPTLDDLSRVAPNHPVCLKHASGHSIWVNQKAIELAGIDISVGSDEGGEVIRNELGLMTGIFTENAMDLIVKRIPEWTLKKKKRAVRLAIQECLKHGITTFHDAGVDQQILSFFKEELDQIEKKPRLYIMKGVRSKDEFDQMLAEAPEIGSLNNFLTIRSIKLYADGALGSRGAWLLAPYSDRPDHTGNSVLAPEFLYEVYNKALQKGYQVCTHAIGDRANREVLNQIEKAFQSNHVDGAEVRFRIEHAQHLSLADISRFNEWHVIPSMQAIHMSSDRPWAIDRLGQKRIDEGAYVWQKLLQEGCKVMNGTDVPVEPINPIACFYAAVTRKTLAGEPEGGYEPSQRMTRQQALAAYTINNAYGAFEENIKGTIKNGKLADLTILDQDIMIVAEDKLLDTKVVCTIIDGKIVWKSSELD